MDKCYNYNGLEGDKMYQALYRKYRPQILEDVCGQDTIVKIIATTDIINEDRVAAKFT